MNDHAKMIDEGFKPSGVAEFKRVVEPRKCGRCPLILYNTILCRTCVAAGKMKTFVVKAYSHSYNDLKCTECGIILFRVAKHELPANSVTAKSHENCGPVDDKLVNERGQPIAPIGAGGSDWDKIEIASSDTSEELIQSVPMDVDITMHDVRYYGADNKPIQPVSPKGARRDGRSASPVYQAKSDWSEACDSDASLEAELREKDLQILKLKEQLEKMSVGQGVKQKNAGSTGTASVSGGSRNSDVKVCRHCTVAVPATRIRTHLRKCPGFRKAEETRVSSGKDQAKPKTSGKAQDKQSQSGKDQVGSGKPQNRRTSHQKGSSPQNSAEKSRPRAASGSRNKQIKPAKGDQKAWTGPPWMALLEPKRRDKQHVTIVRSMLKEGVVLLEAIGAVNALAPGMTPMA